jgi:hypothetical protein
LVSLPFCPESPRYLLIKRGLSEKAEMALKDLRGVADVKQEIDEMTNEAEREKLQPKFRFWQLFTTRALLIPTLISIVLHLSQQLSGINAVFYYSSTILEQTGVKKVHSLSQTQRSS